MTVRTRIGTVLSRSPVTAHLVRITLEVDDLPTTGIPDEYVRLMIPASFSAHSPEPPPGSSSAHSPEPVLPHIDDQWNITWPEGVEPPAYRVYTVSDHRWVDGVAQIDIDIALHDRGVGSQWARTVQPGTRIGFVEPHGLYRPAASVPWQLLVCDITGLPALARILRGLESGQRVEATVVLTDDRDRMPLPSAADVDIEWVVVERDTDICAALEEAVTRRELPADGPRYVWFAGEARASRAIRRTLRRERGWPQSDFYTCGYWQIDQETWDARYEQVEEQVIAQARQAEVEYADDEGAMLDAIDDIYEKAGL